VSFIPHPALNFRHAHSDHYTNLSKSWKEGPIYCSETTANLVVHMLGVEPRWVVSCSLDIEQIPMTARSA